jgi:penicillin-binding protein 1A
MLVGDEYYYAENPPGAGVNNLDAPGHGTPAEEKAKDAVKNELF